MHVVIDNEASVNRDEDTSSEGAMEAINNTRVAQEGNMVEVTDQSCLKPTIVLCSVETQTEPADTTTVALSPKSPSGLKKGQYPFERLTTSATQVSPVIKAPVAQQSQEQDGPEEKTKSPVKLEKEIAVEVISDEPVVTEEKQQEKLEVKPVVETIEFLKKPVSPARHSMSP